jgi:hypothetical protein
MSRVEASMRIAMSRALEGIANRFNPIARRILSSRFHGVMSRRLMLLTVTGRRTARAYTMPVSYVEDGGGLLVPSGGRWKKNLGEGRPARVQLRGESLDVTSELITDPDALADVLGRMLQLNPAIALFTGIWRGPDGRPDQSALDRMRSRGFAVARLRLDAPR